MFFCKKTLSPQNEHSPFFSISFLLVALCFPSVNEQKNQSLISVVNHLTFLWTTFFMRRFLTLLIIFLYSTSLIVTKNSKFPKNSCCFFLFPNYSIIHVCTCVWEQQVLSRHVFPTRSRGPCFKNLFISV